jgi:outer membrane protein assembly factor BamB
MSQADASNPFESPGDVQSVVGASASKPSRGRLFPPLLVRLMAAGFLLVAALERWFTTSGDHAIVNIVTFLCGMLAFVTLAVWFLFLSGYARRFRLMAAAMGMALFILFAITFRVDRVSGELVPSFRPRWVKKADETLRPAQPAESGTTADLATTTDDDFPQFLGPQRNGRVDDVHLSQDWAIHPPRQLWKQPIGAGWSAFSAVNGFAVTLEQRGPDELVTCYEIASGKLVWSHATKTRHETIPGGTGPRSTPTIDRGQVFAIGATGELVCLDGASGMLTWRDNLLERYHVAPEEDEKGVAWGRSNSPLVVDDLVIVPAGGPATGPWVSLAAFQRQTGELVWEGGDQQVSYSSPILATIAGVRQVVCVHEKSVAGHDLKTGKQLWSYDWPGDSTQNANVSQPVRVSEDQFLLTKGYGQGSVLLEFSKGSTDAFDVKSKWNEKMLLKTKFTTVVVYQQHAYGLSDGIMECVHLATGKREWKKGRYGQGQILGVDNVILVQAESGDVAMIAATPAGFNELGRFNALEGITWNNLCLTGKRLLVRNSEMAACFELP